MNKNETLRASFNLFAECLGNLAKSYETESERKSRLAEVEGMISAIDNLGKKYLLKKIRRQRNTTFRKYSDELRKVWNSTPFSPCRLTEISSAPERFVVGTMKFKNLASVARHFNLNYMRLHNFSKRMSVKDAVVRMLSE